MSTDTALLVTDIILNENRKFEDIPFITNPEIANPTDPMNTVVMEGFRYVST
jgi:ribosome biogenesis SPOUT family RNA methylase Rps3